MADAETQDWDSILDAYMGMDNARRAHAEQMLRRMMQHPDQLLGGLVHVLTSNSNVHMRKLAAVLVRQAMFHQEEQLWFRVSERCRGEAKAALLESLPREQEVAIQKIVSSFIGEIGMAELEDGLWPELMPWCYAGVTGSDASHKAGALLVLEQLGAFIALNMEDKFDTFVDVFGRSMEDAGSPVRVRVHAARAAATIVCVVDQGSSAVQTLSPLAAPLLALLLHLLDSHDIESAVEVISLMIDVADQNPTFFKPVMSDAVSALLSVANTKLLPDRVRRLAFEFVVAWGESVPALARRLAGGGLVRRVVPVAFEMLLEHGDDPDWETREESESSDPTDNVEVACSALHRLSRRLGGAHVIPIIRPMINTCAGNTDDWRYRFAAAAALTYVAESVPEETSAQELASYGEQLVGFARDDVSRIRYMATQGLGYFCQFHGPTFQRAAHAFLMPVVHGLLCDPSKRVQAQAAAMLVNYCNGSLAEHLQPYVDTLLGTLLNMVRDGGRTVKEWALTAITGMGETAKDAFRGRYRDLFPHLLHLVEDPFGALGLGHAGHDHGWSEWDLRPIQGKALECFTVLIHAAGADVFAPDETRVMDALRRVTSTVAEPGSEDPLRSYVLQAFVRLAQVLGREFAPYLDFVVGFMIASARVDTDVKRLSQEEREEFEAAQAEDDAMDEEFTIRYDDDGALRVRTSSLLDKELAVETLCQLAKEVGNLGIFGPYVDATANVLLPMLDLTGEVYEDLRSYVVESSSELIAAAAVTNATRLGPREAVPANRGQLTEVLQRLIRALKVEKNHDVITAMVASIKFSLDEACAERVELGRDERHGPQFLPVPVSPDGNLDRVTFHPLLRDDELAEVVDALVTVFRHSRQRVSVKLASLTAEQEELDEMAEEEIHGEIAAEADLQNAIMDCLGSVLRTHDVAGERILHEKFMPFVEELAQNIDDNPTDAKLALFVVDDLIESGPETGPRILERYFPLLVRGCELPCPDLQQAAVYGIGVAAVAAGKSFQPFASDAAHALVRIITRSPEQAREEQDDQGFVHDNAVSALGKLLHHVVYEESNRATENGARSIASAGPDFQPRKLMRLFVDRLPLESDAIECRVAVQYLCLRIRAGCQDCLGDGGDGGDAYDALPSLLGAFAFAATNRTVRMGWLEPRLQDAVQRLEQAVPGDVLRAAMQHAGEDAQRVIPALAAGRSVLAELLHGEDPTQGTPVPPGVMAAVEQAHAGSP